jgi:hypothetical protein
LKERGIIEVNWFMSIDNGVGYFDQEFPYQFGKRKSLQGRYWHWIRSSTGKVNELRLKQD